MKDCTRSKDLLDAQHEQWEKTYSEEADFFGEDPSYPAKQAEEMFRDENKLKILEFGAGQGRDALFFASKGYNVTALDYSVTAVKTIQEKAEKLGLTKKITAISHDVRKTLPFADESFDVCYCHMLYCMALCTSELESLFNEVRRILKPMGLSIYTVRTTSDPHYGKGISIGEDMFEMGGYIVHFFSKGKVERLAKGFDVVKISEFEEGELPRKLFYVKLRKRI